MTMRGLRIGPAVLGGVLLAAVCLARNPGDPLKPGFNLFSKQQDIQLGQEAAQQVRQQYQVVQNQPMQDYLKRVGERLAATPRGQTGRIPLQLHPGECRRRSTPSRCRAVPCSSLPAC